MTGSPKGRASYPSSPRSTRARARTTAAPTTGYPWRASSSRWSTPTARASSSPRTTWARTSRRAASLVAENPCGPTPSTSSTCQGGDLPAEDAYQVVLSKQPGGAVTYQATTDGLTQLSLDGANWSTSVTITSRPSAPARPAGRRRRSCRCAASTTRSPRVSTSPASPRVDRPERSGPALRAHGRRRRRGPRLRRRRRPDRPRPRDCLRLADHDRRLRMRRDDPRRPCAHLLDLRERRHRHGRCVVHPRLRRER